MENRGAKKTSRPARGAAALLAAITLLLSSCYEEELVGNPCEDDSDCNPQFALGGGGEHIQCIELVGDGGGVDDKYCGGKPRCERSTDCLISSGYFYTCENTLCSPVMTPSVTGESSGGDDSGSCEPRPADAADLEGKTLVATLFSTSEHQRQRAASEVLSTVNEDFFAINCKYPDSADGNWPHVIAEYLAKDLGVAAIIGPGTSEVSKRIVNKLCSDDADQAEFSEEGCWGQGENVPVVISPSATSTKLDLSDEPRSEARVFWRTVGDDSSLSKAIAAKIGDYNHCTTILYEDNSYGRQFKEEVRRELVEKLTPNGSDKLSNGQGEVQKHVLNHFEEVSFDSIDDDHLTRAWYNFERCDDLRDDGDDPSIKSIVLAADDIPVIREFFAKFYCFFNDPPNGKFIDQKFEIYLNDTAANERLFEEAEAKCDDSALDTSAPISGLLEEGHRVRAARFEIADNDVRVCEGVIGAEEDEVDFYAPFGHDAAWLAIFGATWAEKCKSPVTGAEIAKALHRFRDAGAGPFTLGQDGYEQFKVEIESLDCDGEDTFDLIGASGALDYDAYGNIESKAILFDVINEIEGKDGEAGGLTFDPSLRKICGGETP